MNHEVERATVPEPNGREMTHIARRQTTDVERLGKRDNGPVYKAETKIGIAPIDLQSAGELIQCRRRVRERTTSDVPHEGAHRAALVTKEIINFGQHERRDKASPGTFDGIAKQPMIRRIY